MEKEEEETLATETEKCIIQKILNYCTFNLNRAQKKEYRAMYLWGAMGLNQDLFLVHSLHDFCLNFGMDGYDNYCYDMGRIDNLTFSVTDFINPTLYMIASDFWFYVIHQSRLFPHGCVYYYRRRQEAKEFAVVFEDGQYFLCSGSKLKDKFMYFTRLMMAIEEMKQASSLTESYGLL